VALLVDYGFNKFSMGVQSMDPEVLELHARGGQRREHVAEAIANLRQAGVRYINADFMLGLAGDTAETFLHGLGELMKLGPDTIMLTKVQPQVSYLRRHFDGDVHRFVAHYDAEFLPAVEPMVELARKHGYGSDNPYENELGWRLWKRGFRPPYDETRPYYCTGGEIPMSTLGIGRFAKSKIFGRLVYENSRAEPVFEPEAPHFRGVDVSRDYEIARWVITQISRKRQLDKDVFRGHFGAEPEDVFPYVLEALAEQGATELHDDVIRFATGDTRELFVLSRLFLDRQTVVAELSSADWDELTVRVGPHRFHFRIDHVGGRDTTCLASTETLALQLLQSSEPGSPTETLVVEVLRRLFLRAAQDRPWLSALEVAEQVAARADSALGANVHAEVTLASQRDAT
jgi:hypothetical protein